MKAHLMNKPIISRWVDRKYFGIVRCSLKNILHVAEMIRTVLRFDYQHISHTRKVPILFSRCIIMYLYNLISYHQPSCVLRSSSKLLLEVLRTKTEFGCRAFSSASPQIWNYIPLPIRYSPSLDSFKRHLKTFLFTSHNPSAWGLLVTVRTSDLSLP